MSSEARTTGPRSWRNRNPGNVRPVALPDKWQGQVDLDRAPGGPFVIFGDDASGWRAICKVLLRYQQHYNLKSVRAMIDHYAPPSENATASYIARVCAALGVGADDPVDVSQWQVMRQMLLAISAVEGGAACPPWPPAEIDRGMQAAGLVPPA